MKSIQSIIITTMLLCSIATVSLAQGLLFQTSFYRSDFEAKGFIAMGAGFDSYPMPEYSFGDIAVDNAFEGATDGFGMRINLDPGEGIMILTPPIATQNCALLRCSARLNAAHGSLTLASVDQGESVFVSTISPNNIASFVNQYGRIADFFLPPSIGFQGIIQIINTSETEPLSASLDNFEVLEFGSGRIAIDLAEIMTGGINGDGVPSGPTITVPIDLPSGAKKLEMVYINPGTFTMGSPSDERGRRSDLEWLPHQVTLTKGFYMGKYEVTQAQYEAVMGNNPAYFKTKPNNPVEQVTWHNAAQFCNALSQMEGLQPVYIESGDWAADLKANGYRLPTEAEWEYACRAGTTTRFSFGDALECADSGENYCEIMDQYMWWWGNNTYQGNVYGTKEVGLKHPNPWGLYDMHGNVWEWCGDWWQDPTNRGDQVDPFGQVKGSYRVLRGGSWGSYARLCRSAYRLGDNPVDRSVRRGFRLCRTP